MPCAIWDLGNSARNKPFPTVDSWISHFQTIYQSKSLAFLLPVCGSENKRMRTLRTQLYNANIEAN